MTENQYRRKVMGCWLGKAVGGTLGQPYEGCEGPLNLTYYNPVPDDMIPNDDLDLQVLWALALDRMDAPTVSRSVLSEAWMNHVEFPCDEYGVAIRNLKMGIPAPISGAYDNWFKDGLGAAIRSEIWACLAPGNPVLAARYAYEDACVDHCGDGVHAEQFLAALESAAFVESDMNELLEAGLTVIPADCRLAAAVNDTRHWCSEMTDWLAVRQRILDKWGSENFTDAVMNLPFVVLALLLGEADFSASICLAVNCGRDADCATATVGAIMGILSPDGVEEKWLRPIGRKLVLNDGIVGVTPPATLDDFTDLVLSLRPRVQLDDSLESTGVQTLLEKHAITADCGAFYPWFAQDENKFVPKLPDSAKPRVFPGALASIPASDVPADGIYLMRFRFHLDRSRSVRVMFNTPSNSRIWIDGDYAFGREGGRMAPSFHRCPKNQYADLDLSAGEHELLAGVAPLDGEPDIRWVVGIGDHETKQWLVPQRLQKR